jgi:hypothetical protein
VRERAALVAVGVVATATGLCWGAMTGDLALTACAGAAIVAGHVLAMRGFGARPVPMTLGVLAAVALLHGSTPYQVLAAALTGIPLGIGAIRLTHGSRSASDLITSEPAAAVAFTTVLFGALPNLPEVAGFGERIVHIAVVAVAAGAWHLAGALGWAFWPRRRRRLSARLWLRRRLGEWQPVVILVVAGAMYAEAVPAVGWWAVVIAGLPYLFGHLAVARLGKVRRTYLQTIRALGRLPEAGGFVIPGHAERTADLAVAAGAELGCSARESDHTEYASLLHGLGSVVLADRSITAAGYGAADVAEWGAAIISESKYLEPVAEIVAAYPRPYRSHGESRSTGVPRSAKLVKVAAAYDEAVSGGMSPVDALEQLHRGAAYDHDPEVVMALRRVLERRGVIAPQDLGSHAPLWLR